VNWRITKKTEDSKSPQKEQDDMIAEYRFDYGKARPNCFADQIEDGRVTVSLDQDVAEVFATSESVNTMLRALLAAMPGAKGQKRGRKPSSAQKGA
jgi:hypothetical protein